MLYLIMVEFEKSSPDQPLSEEDIREAEIAEMLCNEAIVEGIEIEIKEGEAFGPVGE